MPETSVLLEVSQILRQWEEEQAANNPQYDPEVTLTRLADIIEAETESYLKMDPDPFDERHPSRVDPDCGLGQILKVLFRKDTFMNKLVNDYLRENYWSRIGNTVRDSRPLNIAGCRLMLDILPGLEVPAVFQLPEMESLMLRLFSWAEKSVEPLQSYATGLLAAAMEVQEIASNFRDHNARLVPLKLQELHKLQREALESRHQGVVVTAAARPFAHLGQSAEDELKKRLQPVAAKTRGRRESFNNEENKQVSPRPPALLDNGAVMSPPPASPIAATCVIRPSPGPGGECSNSSWAEMESFVIGTMTVYPPTLATRQMLILRYLTPMGEYQDLLSHVFEQGALGLILNYVNVRETKDSRLAFEALKYLAALLCHKKFSIEFINMRGLQMLLKVPRPSIAATGVSICFYYLAYCEDAMDRVSQLPHHIIVELVKYSLWLLECSHDSGRCHATMFFGLSFQFRVILAEFDRQDGLRKLYNIISTLPILSLENEVALNDDEICSARQIVRHVCVALKRYLEAHLCIKAESLRRSQFRGGPFDHAMPPTKTKSSSEEVCEQYQVILDLMPFRLHWEPVDQLLHLGGVMLLLQTIAFTYEWNYNGRAETVRSALDALAVCSLIPQAQLLLCDKIPVDLHLREERITVGINILLGAAEGEIAADSDVQRAALHVLINCVCAPIHRVGGGVSSSARKKGVRSSEDLINKIWECVRSNNGIMVLLQLMMVKTPITDADSIRALACQAMAGLARSETVRQIISKLPLFSNGQFQILMRDPVLQDKRHEHAMFQRYALELMERVLGKSKPTGQELETSLANMHRANVVAQTRILYNDRQLFQLIHQHLLSRGLSEAAGVLHREAGLPGTPIKLGTSANFPPLRPRLSAFSSPALNRSPSVSSSPLTSRTHLSPAIPSPSRSLNSVTTPMGPPLRISLQSRRNNGLPSSGRSLQKQISADHSSIVSTSSSPASKNSPRFESHVTLDSIVTEYLTNQHALCKNPVVPCPQFNLFEPHKCPDPKVKNLSPLNVATRLTRRSLGGPRVSSRLDRRLVHSRFCPVRTFRPTDDEGFYTCCTFLPSDKSLLVGTYQGEVKRFNINTGTEEAVYQCHESYLYHLEASRQNDLLLTSATWRSPQSAVWSIGKVFQQKFALDNESYIEFSKVSQDRIIGTQAEDATIYDVATGRKIMTLRPQISNQYTKNRATFSPLDELVLSDGVLWDVDSGKEIHKFDKLNQTTSGVFHPCGLEVVSNTEVWDLRTFHLLRTVPSLDQCDIKFSPGPAGDAIYSISLEQEMEDETAFESSFKTYDAHDYSSIATIDVKKNIYDLAINTRDTQIGVVENQGVFDSVQESSVRVYDVGRRRDDDDEGEEEDDDEDLDGSEDGSGSASDDDAQDNAPDTDNGNIEDILLDSNNEEEDGDDEEDEEDEDEDDEGEDEDPSMQFSGSEDDDEEGIMSGSDDADSDEFLASILSQ